MTSQWASIHLPTHTPHSLTLYTHRCPATDLPPQCNLSAPTHPTHTLAHKLFFRALLSVLNSHLCFNLQLHPPPSHPPYEPAPVLNSKNGLQNITSRHKHRKVLPSLKSIQNRFLAQISFLPTNSSLWRPSTAPYQSHMTWPRHCTTDIFHDESCYPAIQPAHCLASRANHSTPLQLFNPNHA